MENLTDSTKYLDLAGLGIYDGLIKGVITAGDQANADNIDTLATTVINELTELDERVDNNTSGISSLNTRVESLETSTPDWTNGKIVYDISVAHPDGQGNPTKYATLAAALGANGANIPEAMRKGGMSVEFVHSSDNKYVQARCMAQNFTTDVTQWQGVDDEPTANSNNLVKSGGVYKNYVKIKNSSNLINPDFCTYGAIIDGNGKIVTNFPQTEYCVSDYIKVNGQNIAANSFQSVNYGSFNVYNAAKEMVTTIRNSANYTYNSERGDTYVRICFKWDNNVKKIRANYGDVLLDYEEYNPIGGYIEKTNERINAIINVIEDSNFVEENGSTNIVNQNTCTYGIILNKNGGTATGFPQTEYCVSDYIKVNGQNITANSFNNSGYSSFVVYNKSKIKLRCIVNNSNYVYQQGDYYVRISFRWLNNVQNIRANYGDVLLDYEEYNPIYGYLGGERKLENAIQIASNNLSPTIIKPKTSFNELTKSLGGSVFTALRLAQKFTGKWFVSSFIYKTTGSTLKIFKCLIEDNILVNKGLYETIILKSEWLAPEYGTNVYVVPYLKEIDFIPGVNSFFADNLTGNDNGYIAAGQNISIADKHAIAFGIIGAPSIEDSEIASILNYVHSVKGKTIGFLGDSITEMGYYVSSLSTLCECTCIKYGIAATHIAAIGTAWDEQYPPFEHRVSGMSNDLDAVVVFGGTNDFGHSNTAVFGEFTDYTDANKYTFYAGLHRMCMQLYNKYRGKPIIIMLPIHHGYEVDTPEVIFNNDGTITEGTNPTTHKTFLDYVKAIKEVASYYSFFVIDAYAESGLNPCLETSDARYYFTDGLHPSVTGGSRLAKFMKPELEKIFNSILLL